MSRLMDGFLFFKPDNKGLADRSIRAYRDILQRFEDRLDGRDPLTIDGDRGRPGSVARASCRICIAS